MFQTVLVFFTFESRASLFRTRSATRSVHGFIFTEDVILSKLNERHGAIRFINPIENIEVIPAHHVTHRLDYRRMCRPRRVKKHALLQLHVGGRQFLHQCSRTVFQ